MRNIRKQLETANSNVESVDYCADALLKREGSVLGRKIIKWVLVGVVTFVVIVVLLVGVVLSLIWWDYRTDKLVREWINGPHRDAITLVCLTRGTPTGPVEVMIRDQASLDALNMALQTQTLDAHLGGQSVQIELHLQSGKIITTGMGSVTPSSLLWQPPSGDTWGDWHSTYVRFGKSAPKALLDALSYASGSTGKEAIQVERE